MSFIIWIIIGGILGWLASLVMKTDAQQGLLLNIIVGIVGALLGGWLLAPLFGPRRLLMEHLVFAMWAHVTAFGLLTLLALTNKLGAAIPAWPVVFPYLGYFVLAASRYYGVSRIGALWRGVAHLALYAGLVLIPAAIFVAFTALDFDAFAAFYNA